LRRIESKSKKEKEKIMDNVSGAQLVLALVLGLAFLIFLILKTKIHAFLALISAAVAIGLIAGLDAAKITDAISAFIPREFRVFRGIFSLISAALI
jgi:hypothetical protein